VTRGAGAPLRPAARIVRVAAPKKPALGRGLSALIPSARSEIPSAGVRTIPLDLLDANRRQPRRRFDDDGLEELSRSIKKTGILQPVLVAREGGRFRIVAGERRVRAARLAGLREVPVLVREGVTDRDHLLLALVENVQRRDLTALEEAEAYRHLRDDFGLTQEDVAERVGKDRATVANALRLLKLSAAVRAALEDGSLSAGHARALLPLPSAGDQELLAREIVRRGLSVRATEARVAALEKGAGKRKKARRIDADTRDAEVRLGRALGTRVEIRRKKRGGEIRVAFFSEAELIGLFEKLSGKGTA
jgi:ParB family transcriptional regulator, chromosome partitioning protein